MRDNEVKCADCGSLIPVTDAYSRFILGAFIGYSRGEYLCHDCRYPEDRTVREPMHGTYLDDHSVVEMSDWDRDE